MDNNFSPYMWVKLRVLQYSCLYMVVFLDDYHFDNPLHMKMRVGRWYNKGVVSSRV
jgi:hypothetical protein